MQELSIDIVDMIKDASKEEKQALHKKLSVLINKVEQVVGKEINYLTEMIIRGVN